MDRISESCAHARTLNQNDQLVKAAAAIGGSDTNIETATDIVSLLMLQNKVPMTTPDFTQVDLSGGSEPFTFYVQFANSGSSYYTWNERQDRDIESFAAEKVAMIFNYHRAVSKISQKAPFLDFGVAAMPQLEGSTRDVNYADYWGFAVSKQSQNQSWSWDFILQTMTNANWMRAYSSADNYPPALLLLIKEKIGDHDMGVFAKQALTAETWHQKDETAIRRIFSDAIRNTLSGQEDVDGAFREIEDQLSELMN